MANTSGNAYGLTLLCPIQPGVCQCEPKETREQKYEKNESPQSHAAMLQDHLEQLDQHNGSPLARVNNTYIARLFVLGNVLYQGKPAIHEHLKNQYMVFTSNFHGKLTEYLEGMWGNIEDDIREIWQHCIGFDQVRDATSFVRYMKKCQVKTTFFFMGSTDVSQAEQLKALYLKQEFSKFVTDNQGQPLEQLQAAFKQFVNATQPRNLSGPTWCPGQSTLEP